MGTNSGVDPFASSTAQPAANSSANSSAHSPTNSSGQAVRTHTAQPGPAFHWLSYLLGLCTALVLVGGAVLLLRRPDPAPIVLQPPPTVGPTATAIPTATPAPLVIFVSGAVAKPGLYTLAPGSRVSDALLAAGGVLAGVDPAVVNQAEHLFDGAQLYVPGATPLAANAPGAAALGASAPAGSAPAGSAPAGNAPVADTLALPARSQPVGGLSGLLPTPTPPASNPGASAGLGGAGLGGAGLGGASLASAGVGAAGLINVNTASAEELDALPGIGPARALDIIANRPFRTVEDLERVPGIGPATLERLRPLVTVGP